MKDDKNQMEDPEELKAKEAPEMNYVNKPNETVPTLNSDSDPQVGWHLESGEKINEYDKY